MILLGEFLRSVGRDQPDWTFEDTLTQIGLGYPFLFLLGFRTPRVPWSAVVLILVGYWAARAVYPLPTADFDDAPATPPAGCRYPLLVSGSRLRKWVR